MHSYYFTYPCLCIGGLLPITRLYNFSLIVVLLARLFKRFKKRSRSDHVVTYGETLWPWMRKFVRLWISLAVLALLTYAPHWFASSVTSLPYAHGSALFWVIYAFVCGWFFSARHWDDTDDGPWVMSSTAVGYIIARIRKLFGLL